MRLFSFTFSAETLHILGRESTKSRPRYFATEGKWKTTALLPMNDLQLFPYLLFVLCSKGLCFPSLKKSSFLGWHATSCLILILFEHFGNRQESDFRNRMPTSEVVWRTKTVSNQKQTFFKESEMNHLCIRSVPICSRHEGEGQVNSKNFFEGREWYNNCFTSCAWNNSYMDKPLKMPSWVKPCTSYTLSNVDADIVPWDWGIR